MIKHYNYLQTYTYYRVNNMYYNMINGNVKLFSLMSEDIFVGGGKFFKKN